MRNCEIMKLRKPADALRAVRALAVCVAACFHFFAFPHYTAGAAPIPWRSSAYTLVARDMDLRTALDTFAVAQGLSVSMSPSVSGVFSGDFREVPPQEFLDKLATTHNLVWYYDGAALYVYGAGEIATLLVDLKYMKAGEVRGMLAELGVEDGRFPLKTASDDELVMVSGPPRYVSLVAEMIAKADKLREKRTFNEVEVRIFPLVHTWADDVSFRVTSPESTLTIRGVARLLEEMMNASAGTKTHEQAVTNDIEALDARMSAEFRPVIRAENRINAVVVRDVSSRMPMYEKLIRELDVPQKLIEIGITVVELSRNDALDWQLSLGISDRHSDTEGGIGQNMANLLGPAMLSGMGLAGALTHAHSSYAISASLSALKEKGKARSISRTSLLTVNNLAAEMTDMQSYHARVVGTEVATLEEVTAGTKLQIKPRILPSIASNMPNQVWLSLELDDGGFESVTVDAMPMTRSSRLQTQTAVYESESIMLAGYLRDIEEDAGWGIPYLRDIPWIGWIFGGKSTRKETVQRMFILTPHIVDLDGETLARLQATRLRDVTEAEKMQDDAEMSDNERERRDLERKDSQERRREKVDDALERRKAEFEHDKGMRQVERDRQKMRLLDDISDWKAEEESARAKLESERAKVESERARRGAEKAAEEAAKADLEPEKAPAGAENKDQWKWKLW